jgi:hypothetical protein
MLFSSNIDFPFSNTSNPALAIERRLNLPVIQLFTLFNFFYATYDLWSRNSMFGYGSGTFTLAR